MAHNRCPACGKELKTILYTEQGRKIWNGIKWEEDETAGTIYFECPECGAELEYEDLERMGVI